MSHPRPLFRLFSVFSNKQYIFSANQCEKCPSSLQCQDLNLQPLEHESTPVTSRPELPSNSRFFFLPCCAQSSDQNCRTIYLPLVRLPFIFCFNLPPKIFHFLDHSKSEGLTLIAISKKIKLQWLIMPRDDGLIYTGTRMLKTNADRYLPHWM